MGVLRGQKLRWGEDSMERQNRSKEERGARKKEETKKNHENKP
jgi:hypothetical protein